MFIKKRFVFLAGQLYARMCIMYMCINSTIYRKGEANGIIKRAKRGELRTRSIKILSARRGLSRRARPLTARRLFICSTLAFECRGEFLAGPSLCEADCLKEEIRRTKRDARRETEVSFFNTFIKILEPFLYLFPYFFQRVPRIFTLSPLPPFLAAIPFALLPL